MNELSNLKPPKGSRRKRKRVGKARDGTRVSAKPRSAPHLPRAGMTRPAKASSSISSLNLELSTRR